MNLNTYRNTIKLDNGLSVSVVSHDLSYGGRDGLFEAVIVDQENNLIHDSLQGYLTFAEVGDFIQKAALQEKLNGN